MNAAEAAKQYEEKLRPEYEAFARKIVELTQDLVEGADVSVAQIDYRAKTAESLADKIDRKQYKDPFSQIKDLAGVRIVTYYNDDAQQVADILGNEFLVSAADSVDKFTDLDVNAFGYRSLHVVCQVSQARSTLPEWRRYADKFVEIQVRSVLQHAWAAISHKLDYKSPSQAPVALRRQLFRLSALLELADGEFATIRDRSDEFTEAYSAAVPAGDLAYDINVKSLGAFLEERVDLEGWENAARAAGAVPQRLNQGEYDRTVAFLVDLLQAMGLHTLEEVEQVLQTAEDRRDPALAHVVAVLEKHELALEDFSLDSILLVLVAINGIKISPSLEYQEVWRPEFCDALDELRASGLPEGH